MGSSKTFRVRVLSKLRRLEIKTFRAVTDLFARTSILERVLLSIVKLLRRMPAIGDRPASRILLDNILQNLIERSIIFEVPSLSVGRQLAVSEDRVKALAAAVSCEPRLKVVEKSGERQIKIKHRNVTKTINIWSREGQNLIAPSWNLRGVVVGARYETNQESSFRGKTILTHPDLTIPCATERLLENKSEGDFPVDVVYLWVDGTDPDWLATRDNFIASSEKKPDSGHSAHASRFRQADELKFSIRSLGLLPWVNNIFVVTAGQVPDWMLTSHPKIRLIDHAEIIEPEYLPTFNSHSISANIHRIPGLAEHFLYFNDDLFIGRPTGKSSWFTPDGLAQVMFTRTLQPGPSASLSNPTLQARRNTIQLALNGGLVTSPRSLQHAPHPMRRSVMERAWEMFPSELAETTASKFRSNKDIVPEWIHNFLALTEGSAQMGKKRSYRYLAINSRSTLADCMSLLLHRRLPEVFCLNDSSEVGPSQALDSSRAAERIKTVLNMLYPLESRFEKGEI